ncbi:MAG: MBL fold metallo-hydrolase [Pseudomonadota bacterium]
MNYYIKTMRPCFHPRLVNDPFGDPTLFIPFLYEKRALMFDLGDVCPLSSRDILKLTHIFVTHTHVDHFIGFDHVLRILLGREKSLHLFGPPGFLQNVEGKLAGYTWNLVENYSNDFSLNVTEINVDRMVSKVYRCRSRFKPTGDPRQVLFQGKLLEEPSFSVHAVHLDHEIPCLGLALKERFHVNVLKDRLKGLNLPVGPWLKKFKDAIYNKENEDMIFKAVWKEGPQQYKREFLLGELKKEIVRITPGQKIVYITDIRYTPENVERVVDFARDADALFIEASFLDTERETAYEKYHLTARQAGSIARKAGAKQFKLFHFSPRYTHKAELLYQEAEAAFFNTA